jgi:hypothetical protein
MKSVQEAPYNHGISWRIRSIGGDHRSRRSRTDDGAFPSVAAECLEASKKVVIMRAMNEGSWRRRVEFW